MSIDTCEPVAFPNEKFVFNLPLFFAALVVWAFCFICMINGPKSISFVVYLSVVLPVGLLIALVSKVAVMDTNAIGLKTMFGQMNFLMEKNVPYDIAQNSEALLMDAFQEVFLSIGVCTGTFFAYGSYSDRKQPVIGNAFLIGIFDFMISIVSAILAWSISGFLRAKGDPAYAQMNSVGLAFVAMPRLADYMGEEG